MHATGMEPQAPQAEPWLHVVLYQPEIPQNTGNIGRTCVALGAKLWLVRPIGFRLDASRLRRAGLDYWQDLDWEVVGGWDELCERLDTARMWLVTKFGAVNYADAQYSKGDIIVLGRESCGLPESLRETHPQDRQISLPMPGPVRSLNLSTTAGVVMYEAYRQLLTPPRGAGAGGEPA